MADAALFELNDLCVSAAGADPLRNPVLDSLSLTIHGGETHLLVGNAGAGKTVLAKAAFGSPMYPVERGTILFRGDNINGWPPEARARAGLFLGSPGGAAFDGITVFGLLGAIAGAGAGDGPGFSELHQQLTTTVESIGLPASLLHQEVSSLVTPETSMAVEVLQLLTLAPELAIIDLPEAAVTADSIEILAAGLARSRVERPGTGTLIMSRYDRLLNDLKPDNIHVLSSGRITASDGSELAANGTTKGYESLT